MGRKKEKVSITLDPDTLKWVDERVAADYHYADRSHLIEIAVKEMRERLGETR